MTFPMIRPPAGHEVREARIERVTLQRELGLTEPDAELDGFATRLAEAASTSYAMVNIFGEDRQNFLGLHAPNDGSFPDVGRNMALDNGYCPDVVRRGIALVLPDVFASPKFSGNPVVDLIGIRTYAGAPLIYQGVVLGTVCAVGPTAKPSSTGQASLTLIKEHRDRVMDFLLRRAGLPDPLGDDSIGSKRTER